ncbi:receptor-like protein 6 [Pistacia vera]|uniref:receptor-like protein 6 n=1 Tax=Pistacia vera TaxID=55513 RepID=UPI001262EAE9|nr:receptor-like protein 6 [Pistacia vera]
MRSWIEDSNCCSWDGVTCNNVTGHVIGLDLSCSWLHGIIPSNNTLFSLPHIQILNLSFNDFDRSQILSDINRFPKLTTLNLSSSNFSGQIPYEISHLSKLVSLDLSGNQALRLETTVLEGLVQNVTKLKELFLDSVDMSTIILPGSLMNLSSFLTSLSLNYCGLKGSIPDNIFRLPNLQFLSLWDNFRLTVAFPKGNWSSPLRFLYMSGMILSEELPDSIGGLRSLRQLSLHNCSLMRSVPIQLGNLTELTVLDLSDNHFSGHIPSSLSNLPQLHHLDLSSNNFSGEIPNIFTNLSQLSFLSCTNNRLVGPIPSHVSEVRNLAFIYLHGNSLNGTIPSWLSTLPLLQDINLSNNQLNGNIPEFQSNSLQTLYLRNNSLDGSIPSSIFELPHLTELELSLNNLSGVVELNTFSKLKNLRLLDLSDNSFSLNTTTIANSSFPKLRYLFLSACNVTEFPDILRTQDQLIHLDLSKNKIHGQVPNWIWYTGKNTLRFLHLYQNFLTGIDHLPWKNLQFLDLRSNLFKGPLPVPPPFMKFIFMSNNSFSGEIPRVICNLKILEILDLSSNNLSGTIPKCMGKFSRLHVMDLRKNRFYGPIPETFGKGNNFRTLNFNDNALEGSVSRSLLNCTMLEVLDLGNNKINDIFPHWLENLPKLQVLVLRSNKFYGDVWSSGKVNHSFSKLRIFDLSNNNFTGSLPVRSLANMKAMMSIDEAEQHLEYMGEKYYQDSVVVTLKGSEIQLQKILTTFTTIDFSNNNFNGDIPKFIGNFQALRLLNLSRNNLMGCIPSLLGNLTNLESLDLSVNKLAGEIPWQLTNLNFLQVLNLSENQLVGLIPQDNHFSTFSNDSYSGNWGLCGFPLSKKCSNGDGQKPDGMISHDRDNILSWVDWHIILMGYGCGLGIGFSIGYIVFSTGKPKRLVRIIEKEKA